MCNYKEAQKPHTGRKNKICEYERCLVCIERTINFVESLLNLSNNANLTSCVKEVEKSLPWASRTVVRLGT